MRFAVPTYSHGNQRRLLLPLPPTVEFMEWVGYWYGDGWIENERDVGFIVCAKDHDVFEILIERTTRWFGTHHVRPSRRGSIEAKVASVVLVRWMRAHGFDKKQIPQWVETLPFDRKAAFLRGFFEADGCAWIGVSKRRTQRHLFITLKHQEVVLCLQRLLSELCVQSTVNKTTHGYWNLRIRSCNMRDFQQRVGFLGKRKRKILSEITGEEVLDPDELEELREVEEVMTGVASF